MPVPIMFAALKAATTAKKARSEQRGETSPEKGGFLGSLLSSPDIESSDFENDTKDDNTMLIVGGGFAVLIIGLAVFFLVTKT